MSSAPDSLWKVVHELRIQQLCLVNAFSIPRFQSLDLDFFLNSLVCEFSLNVVFLLVSRYVCCVSSHETAQTSSHFAVLTHMRMNDPQLVV